MFKNYLKIALRNLLTYKTYSLINILGLATGVACCILILLYVQDELSFDSFHKNAEHIFRVQRTKSALTSAPLAPALANEFPEVQQALRIEKLEKQLVHYRGQSFYENNILMVDDNFFNFFSFSLVKGNTEAALRQPTSVLLTQETAHKYFGNEEPLGQVLTFDDDGKQYNLKVTGIVTDLPANSSITFDMLVPFKILYGINPRLENWRTNWLYTYILLNDKSSYLTLQEKLPAFFENKVGEAWTNHRIQPFTDIYLHSNVQFELGKTGSIAYVYIFSAISVLILLIACVNYINLATARSVKRGKEVGIRKVMGANKNHLIKQFIGEAFTISLFSTALAVALAELALPALNAFAQKSLSLPIQNPAVILALLALAGFISLLAGGYPAFVISAFQPIAAIQRPEQRQLFGVFFRKGLVVFQFVISIALICGSLIIYQQLHFLQNANLGLEKKQKLIVPFESPAVQNSYKEIKNELKANPNIVSVSASGNVPGKPVSDFYYLPEGVPKDNMTEFGWDTYFIDEDFIPTLGMILVRGRNFSKTISSDEHNFLINETAYKSLLAKAGEDWEDPIGKRLTFYVPGKKGWKVYSEGVVIGVVKDFHYLSLHEVIGPMALQFLPQAFGNFIVNLKTSNLRDTMAFVKDTWHKFAANEPFEYYFLDDTFDQLYRSEQRLNTLFIGLTSLAIFVACLGLFGLSAFTAEQRTKEIGIRKVLGASTENVVSLLSKEFVKLVLIANIVAWPLAWYASQKWLQNFAYRIDIGPGTFLLATAMAILIALFTVSSQTMKAALTNPVESLRYE